MLFYLCYFSLKLVPTNSRKKPTSSIGNVAKEDTSKKLG